MGVAWDGEPGEFYRICWSHDPGPGLADFRTELDGWPIGLDPVTSTP